MEVKKGIAVSHGIAIAPAMVLDTYDFVISRRRIDADDVSYELELLEKAIKASVKELEHLRNQIAERHGEDTARIFDFHMAILQDPAVIERMKNHIKQDLYSAPLAVSSEMKRHVKDFLEIDDPYFRERVKDVYDVERRLLRHLTGQRKEELSHLTADVVVVAHDLTPSQTAGLDRTHVLAFATDAGGHTSHTAIIARALGIPAVVGLNDITADVDPGDLLVVDGNRGLVIIDPDEETLKEVQQLQREQSRMEADLVEVRTLPAVTKDGVKITILGNIEFPDEVSECMEYGAEGVGLYRTEFLYLSREREPTEDEHYQAYVKVLEEAGDLPVVIRTFDLGADKYTQERQRSPERNPFLGCRSIRYCLRHIDMFKRQLRAILRASVKGNVKIMFPLISQVMELRQAKMVLNDVIEDLEEEEIEFKRDIPIGVMIETPAAAIKAHYLAREVDFFSIGTNDLIQYTLAVDRANERVASLYTPGDPAVIRLIREVIKEGNKANISVSLCGEMAGEPEFTLLLLGLGLRAFSMAPHSIPEIKRVIRSVTIKQAQSVARRVLKLETDRQIISVLRDEVRKILPELYV